MVGLGVPGERDNGRKVIDFFADRGMCVGNTYSQDKSLRKYTRMARDEDGVEVMSMIDLMMVKKVMLGYVQNVRAVRGIGRGLSYHHIVLCKFELVGAWIRRR